MARFFLSFKNAVIGISLALKQRNLKIQLVLAVLVVVFGFYFQISIIEWVLLVIAIANVFSAEIFNSAVEDLSDQQKKLGLKYEDAGSARDLAAGAVLMQAFMSVVIGMIVFIPKIIEKFFT